MGGGHTSGAAGAAAVWLRQAAAGGGRQAQAPRPLHTHQPNTSQKPAPSLSQYSLLRKEGVERSGEGWSGVEWRGVEWSGAGQPRLRGRPPRPAQASCRPPSPHPVPVLNAARLALASGRVQAVAPGAAVNEGAGGVDGAGGGLGGAGLARACLLVQPKTVLRGGSACREQQQGVWEPVEGRPCGQLGTTAAAPPPPQRRPPTHIAIGALGGVI